MSSRRVPVEHRLLGLDRRSLPYAAAAAAIWALWALVLPWVDGKIAWDDPVESGDVFQVTDTVTITPPVGWGVQAGIRADEDTRGPDDFGQVVITKDGVLIQVRSGDWSGTPTELLDQISKITSLEENDEGFHVAGQVETITTDGGDKGATQGFVAQRTTGKIAAFVFDDTGIEFQVVGPPGQVKAHASEISDMIESIDASGEQS